MNSQWVLTCEMVPSHSLQATESGCGDVADMSSFRKYLEQPPSPLFPPAQHRESYRNHAPGRAWSLVEAGLLLLEPECQGQRAPEAHKLRQGLSTSPRTAGPEPVEARCHLLTLLSYQRGPERPGDLPKTTWLVTELGQTQNPGLPRSSVQAHPWGQGQEQNPGP